MCFSNYYRSPSRTAYKITRIEFRVPLFVIIAHASRECVFVFREFDVEFLLFSGNTFRGFY